MSPTRLLPPLLLAACGGTGSTVDHAAFWGTWRTMEPAEGVVGDYRVTTTMWGEAEDGRDTRFLFRAIVTHGAGSTTPGCEGTQWWRGSALAVCDEAPVADPTSPLFPAGDEVDGGCLEFVVEEALLGRTDCEDPAHDQPLSERPLEQAQPALPVTSYARPSAEVLWLDWSPELTLRRCDVDGGCDGLAWPE